MSHRTTPAAPARENLEPIVAMGVSIKWLSRLTGVSSKIIESIMAGRKPPAA